MNRVPTRAQRLYWESLSRIPIDKRRRLLFMRAHGRRLPRTPVTFTEKVNFRILYDRRPVLSTFGDKEATKRWAVTRGPEVRVPETLWLGPDIRELPSSAIAGREWVAKPNHSSGFAAFGSGIVDLSNRVGEIRSWLPEDIYAVRGEWAYAAAHRAILVEERIGSPEAAPEDFKFFVFDGVARLVQHDRGRFGRHSRRLYSRDWDPLDVRVADFHLADVVEAPPAFQRMRDTAEMIGAGFDFLRVDLYAVQQGVYLGEVTAYPGSGLEPYRPTEFDYVLGQYWTLPITSLAIDSACAEQ